MPSHGGVNRNRNDRLGCLQYNGPSLRSQHRRPDESFDGHLETNDDSECSRGAKISFSGVDWISHGRVGRMRARFRRPMPTAEYGRQIQSSD